MNIEDNIRGRLARFAEVARLEPVRNAVERALKLHTSLRAKAKEIGDDQTLSAIGRRAKAESLVRDEARGVLRVQKTLTKLADRQAAARAALAPRPIDKSDAAAAVARSDLRSMLRGMPMAERMKHLLAKDADRRLLEAVVELPDIVSGITAEIRQHVTAALIERDHPGAAAELERDGEALELLKAATETAVASALAVSEVPAHQFAAFIEKSAGDPVKIDAEVALLAAQKTDAPAPKVDFIIPPPRTPPVPAPDEDARRAAKYDAKYGEMWARMEALAKG